MYPFGPHRMVAHMADDFYPFVDSGDPAPDNSHITGAREPEPAEPAGKGAEGLAESTVFATRIAVYDDMLSTPRVIVVQPKDPRSYLEEVTNTVYRCMKEQGGSLSLMVIRELVENFIHAHFTEPIVSILDDGNTIRFADQGPGINDKERAFEFGVTSANRSMKRYIRGTGAGLPMVQQYLENAGGAVSIEDNLGAGTVVTVSVDPARVAEIEGNSARGAAVRAARFTSAGMGRPGQMGSMPAATYAPQTGYPPQQPQGFGAHGTEAGPYPQMGGYAPRGMAGPGPTGYPGAYQTAPYPGGAPYQPYNGYRPQPYPQEAEAPAPYPYQQQGGYRQPMAAQEPYAEAPAPELRDPYAPGAMPQAGQPVQTPSFQQSGQKFSTIQHAPAQPAEMSPSYTDARPVGAAGAGEPYLTERALQALDFLSTHGQCGPTELTEAFGHSGPTWSRELATLGGYGFIAKHGRKYHLTELGMAWINEHGR